MAVERYILMYEQLEPDLEGDLVKFDDVEALLKNGVEVVEEDYPQQAYHPENRGAAHLTLDGYEIRPGMTLFTKGPSTALVESVDYRCVYGTINGVGNSGALDISGSYAKDPNK